MRDAIDDASVEIQRPSADSEWQVVQGSLRMMDVTEFDIVEYRVHRAGDVWDLYLSPDSNPGFKRSAHSAVDDGTSPAENCWACPG